MKKLEMICAAIIMALSIVLIIMPVKKIKANSFWDSVTIIHNGTNFNGSQVTIATTGATATTLVSASATRPCLVLRNIDPIYKVSIGSHTGITMTNGYMLDVSTLPSTSMLVLGQFNGPIYAYGQGSGTVQPTVVVGACSSLSYP